MTFCVFNDKINEVLSSLESTYLESYYRHGDVAQLADRFRAEDRVDEIRLSDADVSLDFTLATTPDKKDSHDTDNANIRTLHGHLRNLPPVLAANPKFWAWLCHARFSDYCHYRSERPREAYTETDVLRDFYCQISTGERRALVTNMLSRLWWTGHLIWDESAQDHYHFLDLFTHSAYNSKIILFSSSAATRNPSNALGILDALEQLKAERNLSDITRREFVPCTKYLNSIGAVRMIDSLTRAEIRDICLGRLRRSPLDGDGQ